jgi:hypothetical protein
MEFGVVDPCDTGGEVLLEQDFIELRWVSHSSKDTRPSAK